MSQRETTGEVGSRQDSRNRFECLPHLQFAKLKSGLSEHFRKKSLQVAAAANHDRFGIPGPPVGCSYQSPIDPDHRRPETNLDAFLLPKPGGDTRTRNAG